MRFFQFLILSDAKFQIDKAKLAIQASVEEMGDGTAGAIARIQQQIPNLNKNILSQMLMTEGTGFTEETQKGFEVLYRHGKP